MVVHVVRSGATPQIVSAARQEEQKLLAELRFNPTYRRLRAVQALLRAYADDSSVEQSMAAKPDPASSSPEATGRREGSRASDVVKIAREYLRSVGHRAQAPELTQEVERRGIIIDHPRPSSIVASYLSTSPYFDNERPGGYGLVEWKAGAAQPDNEEAGDSAPVADAGLENQTAPPEREAAV